MAIKSVGDRPGARLAADVTWESVAAQAAEALRRGALQPVATDYTFIEQAGVRFVVRYFSAAYQRKTGESSRSPAAPSDKPADPFLPYEEALFVADVSEAHLCLFNKYNVLDLHLLIVTRAYEDQDTWLTARDFEAMWACLGALDGLALYNAGREAGSSQRHRHLQLVKLPLAPDGLPLPIAPWLDSAESSSPITRLAAFPFRHAFTRLDLPRDDDPKRAAEAILARYWAMLRAVGLTGDPLGDPWQTGPYNLLATRGWMLLVPRARDAYQAISVNSLGFAGSLFVRDADQMAVLRAHGPMAQLRDVCYPLDSPRAAPAR